MQNKKGKKKNNQLKDVDHGYLRYANCWEDADILLQGLSVKPSDSVLSIASAGDNCFSLLSQNPKFLVAVDVNQVQLFLVALKKAAFQALEYEEFLQFLGLKSSNLRLQLFQKVSAKLDDNCRVFWENNITQLEKGLIHTGKFERYFSSFRRKIIPLIHSKKHIQQLFEPKEADAQEIFYNKKWNNWRWRVLFKLFFSRVVMGKFGRDPSFLKQVNIPVSQYILQKSQQHLSSTLCQNNYFLRYILQGNFGQHLPHYARKENFYIIKQNIEKLILHKGFMEDALLQYKGLNCFNLSNIFEYMSEPDFETVVQTLEKYSSENSKYAYWNLMVPRKISTAVSSIKTNEKLSNTLTQKDKGFFYSGFFIEVKNN